MLYEVITKRIARLVEIAQFASQFCVVQLRDEREFRTGIELEDVTVRLGSYNFV